MNHNLTVQTDVNIQCPHCAAVFGHEVLPERMLYRTPHGSHVWSCPQCEQPFKVDTGEFTDAWKPHAGKASGEYDPLVVKGYPEDTLMVSEQDAKGYPKNDRPAWFSFFPIALPVAFVALTIYLFGQYL